MEYYKLSTVGCTGERSGGRADIKAFYVTV